MLNTCLLGIGLDKSLSLVRAASAILRASLCHSPYALSGTVRLMCSHYQRVQPAMHSSMNTKRRKARAAAVGEILSSPWLARHPLMGKALYQLGVVSPGANRLRSVGGPTSGRAFRCICEPMSRQPCGLHSPRGRATHTDVGNAASPSATPWMGAVGKMPGACIFQEWARTVAATHTDVGNAASPSGTGAASYKASQHATRNWDIAMGNPAP